MTEVLAMAIAYSSGYGTLASDIQTPKLDIGLWGCAQRALAPRTDDTPGHCAA